MFLAAQARAASSQRWLLACGVLHRLAGDRVESGLITVLLGTVSTKADEDVLQTLLLLEEGAGAQRSAWQTISQDRPKRSAIPPWADRERLPEEHRAAALITRILPPNIRARQQRPCENLRLAAVAGFHTSPGGIRLHVVATAVVGHR